MEMIQQFEEISFEHLPLVENYLVDALPTLVAMFKVNASIEAQIVKLEVKESPTHCACIEEELDGNPLYYDILRYLKGQQYLNGYKKW